MRISVLTHWFLLIVLCLCQLSLVQCKNVIVSIDLSYPLLVTTLCILLIVSVVIL